MADPSDGDGRPGPSSPLEQRTPEPSSVLGPLGGNPKYHGVRESLPIFQFRGDLVGAFCGLLTSKTAHFDRYLSLKGAIQEFDTLVIVGDTGKLPLVTAQ